MKEHIKAIYDPKKQGMTNFDVIESYAEDFTKFIKNGNGTFAQNKYTSAITKQEWLLYKTNGKGIEAMDVYVTSDSTDRSTALRYYYYTNEDNNRKIFYLKAGLNHLPASCYKEKGSIVGFVFEAAPASEFNITITQLPTSILKDLSGNGNHAYLYGGKGKLNSGMGVYKFDFLSDLRINSAYLPYTERQDDKICSLAGHPAGWLFQFTSLSDIPAFKVEVKGIVNDNFTYRWYDENGNRGVDIAINEDGIYELPMSYSVETNNGVGIGCNDLCQDNVCFTQIPDYPDQLCYDGKMYAVCYGFPILTDYTVMAERTWFERQNRACFLSKITTSGTGAFGFEFYNEYNEDTTYSFGRVNNVEHFKDGITYQITNSYNGIVKLDYIVNGKDNAELYIGKLRPSERPAFIGCHGTIIVADRSFTEEEINWLKDNWKKI
ncbi:hypothetical protein NN761_11065 [Bacteroides clarus]|uniref:hypothetical protein n=1 Tax=Bacteroides clarus TaxID=626929 RepID=UPI002101721D|nr:hypothetical protein [Bacteroides clarus]MCQ1546110.1 hypothetical protein [Bacteroides clarus]